MSQQQVEKKKDDEHDADIVMPGFRFHPTEEELIDFYLRRKVEGKRFHVELITFLDLYRYDPWELPALAAIGEKEWFFYVPRDRKYRNGDRPNRVTTSGYWKATGADKTIKTENFETIGLKKTLVFYSGRAPKGVRSSWIMNEYRLPPNETERLQKAEISLCRVYKRTVMEEQHSSLPRSLFPAARSSSSSGTTFKKNKNEPHQNQESAAMERFHTYNNATNPHDQVVIDKQTSRQINTDNNVLITSLALTKNNSHDLPLVPLSLTHSRPNSSSSSEYTGSSNINSVFPKYPSFVSSHVTDDLHRLVNFQHASIYDHHHQHPDLIIPSQPQLHSHPLSLSMLTGTFQAALSDRIWDWSSVTETSNDFHTSFK